MFEWLRRMFRDPGPQTPAEWSGAPPDPSHARFTDLARQVMQSAEREAHRFNHEYIGTEHLLLGLIQVGDGIAAAILRACGASTVAVRREVERIVQRGPGGGSVVLGPLPHTPRTTSSLRWAYEEARFLNHDFVCTEHLLMGMLHESESVASAVLNNFGLTADRARDEVIRLSPPGRDPGAM